MILSDRSLTARLLTGSIAVEPLADGAVRPASIDVRIGTRLDVYRHRVMKRVTTPDDWREMLLNAEHCWWLKPGHAYLATTFEHVRVPDDLACQLNGRSTFARMFLSLHQQAGWLDPGYQGRPTLEITVTLPIEVAPFDPIGQLVFLQLDQPAERSYGHPELMSRYQGDHEPTPARVRSTP